MNTVIRALVTKALPPRLRGAYNYVRHRLFLTKLFGHYASMIPPLELMHDGPVGFEEFKTNGEESFRYYTKLCDVERYLCEVARVFKTGGRCLASFFLLNERSVALMRCNKSAVDLNISLGSCWVANPSDPEAVTGYEEDFVRAVYDKYNLEIKEPIHYGGWRGRETFLSY